MMSNNKDSENESHILNLLPVPTLLIDINEDMKSDEHNDDVSNYGENIAISSFDDKHSNPNNLNLNLGVSISSQVNQLLFTLNLNQHL